MLGARSDCRGMIDRRSSEYLPRFYFDTILFATDQLAFLHEKFGSDRLLIGPDYAFDMGEYDPVEHVMQTPGIGRDDAGRICGLNAVELFGLEPAACGRAVFTTGRPRL